MKNILRTLFAATVSLIVTITGGILVYYYTDWIRERGPEFILTKKEISIPGNQLEAFLITADVENFGREAAKNVEFFIQHGLSGQSIEKHFSLASGPADVRVEESDGTIAITLATLRPRDKLTSTVIFNQVPQQTTSYKIRSDEVIGFSDIEQESPLSVSNVVLFVVTFTSLVAVFAWYTNKRLEPKLRSAMEWYYPRLNNIAFVMMHRG